MIPGHWSACLGYSSYVDDENKLCSITTHSSETAGAVDEFKRYMSALGRFQTVVYRPEADSLMFWV